MNGNNCAIEEVSNDLCALLLQDAGCRQNFFSDAANDPLMFAGQYDFLVRAMKAHHQRSQGQSVLTRQGFSAWLEQHCQNRKERICYDLCFTKASFTRPQAADYYWMLDQLKEQANHTRIMNSLREIDEIRDGKILNKHFTSVLKQVAMRINDGPRLPGEVPDDA